MQNIYKKSSSIRGKLSYTRAAKMFKVFRTPTLQKLAASDLSPEERVNMKGESQ